MIKKVSVIVVLCALALLVLTVPPRLAVSAEQTSEKVILALFVDPMEEDAIVELYRLRTDKNGWARVDNQANTHKGLYGFAFQGVIHGVYKLKVFMPQCNAGLENNKYTEHIFMFPDKALKTSLYIKNEECQIGAILFLYDSYE